MTQTVNFLQEHKLFTYANLEKKAKTAFDELDVKKLPTFKTLQSEYMDLLSEKKGIEAVPYSEKRTCGAPNKHAYVDRIVAHMPCLPT